MDDTTANNAQARIQLLYVPKNRQAKIRQLINRIWFFHEIIEITTRSGENALFSDFKVHDVTAPFNLLITDFSPASPLSPDARQHLITYLHSTRCPLISLCPRAGVKINDGDPNWLHIELPTEFHPQDIEDTNSAIANYWFNLPSF